MRISAHTRMSVLTLSGMPRTGRLASQPPPAHSAGDQGTAECQGRRSADELRMVTPATTGNKIRTQPLVRMQPKPLKGTEKGKRTGNATRKSTSLTAALQGSGHDAFRSLHYALHSGTATALTT